MRGEGLEDSANPEGGSGAGGQAPAGASAGAVPTIHGATPERAALALLSAALSTAEETLLACHPALDDLDSPDGGHAPLPEDTLAYLLVARFRDLHDLLDGYRRSRLLPRCPASDFPFQATVPLFATRGGAIAGWPIAG